MTETIKKKSNHNALDNFKIGLVVSLLSQPFEVIRTSSITGVKAKNTGFSGMLKVMKDIYKLEGMRGFFRGGLVALMKSTLGAGIFFTGIENFHLLTLGLRNSGAVSGNLIDFLSAGTTRFIVTMINNPITVIKTKFEVVGKNEYSSIMGAVHGIYSKHGAKGFYKGIAATLMRDVPWSGI
jgi:hypothetical protein